MRYLFLLVFFVNISYAVTPIGNFKSNRYLGRWYEIARLPNTFEKNCIPPITANYLPNPNNNLQIIVTNSCNTKDNKLDSAVGLGVFVESANIGKLKVTFLPKWLRWLPFGYGDYWVLSTDYNHISIVGSPDHKYLWILSRSRTLKHNFLRKAFMVAKSQGFSVDQMTINSK